MKWVHISLSLSTQKKCSSAFTSSKQFLFQNPNAKLNLDLKQQFHKRTLAITSQTLLNMIPSILTMSLRPIFRDLRIRLKSIRITNLFFLYLQILPSFLWWSMIQFFHTTFYFFNGFVFWRMNLLIWFCNWFNF